MLSKDRVRSVFERRGFSAALREAWNDKRLRLLVRDIDEESFLAQPELKPCRRIVSVDAKDSVPGPGGAKADVSKEALD
jgi:hypothetical protein